MTKLDPLLAPLPAYLGALAPPARPRTSACSTSAGCASMTGFITPGYADRYAQARAELAGWLREGRLISGEDILEGGVRAFPDALPRLFTGENTGKLMLTVP